jgi:hypothetical protein
MVKKKTAEGFARLSESSGWWFCKWLVVNGIFIPMPQKTGTTPAAAIHHCMGRVELMVRK